MAMAALLAVRTAVTIATETTPTATVDPTRLHRQPTSNAASYYCFLPFACRLLKPTGNRKLALSVSKFCTLTKKRERGRGRERCESERRVELGTAPCPSTLATSRRLPKGQRPFSNVYPRYRRIAHRYIQVDL